MLPSLLKNGAGDTYFRLENSSRIINIAGFREAVESFTEKSLNSDEATKFAKETIQVILSFKQKVGKKYGKRLYTAILSNSEAAERLAQLDIEKYGVAKVKFSGTREKPYYSTTRRLHLKASETLSLSPEALAPLQATKGLGTGGTSDIIELENSDYKPEALMNLTLKLFENQTLEFLTYNRVISFCENCKKSSFGTLYKCPSCGSMSSVTTFDPFIYT